MKVLNLYAGLGGNRKRWQGVEVTAVEVNEQIAKVYRQQNPSDKIVIGDAHDYLLHNYDKFDFIWSSPPCQSHTGMIKATRHDVRKYPDMKLYQEILLLKHFFKGKWVVENVKPYYTPLIRPDAVIGRHLFWCNFQMQYFNKKSLPNFINKGGTQGAEELKQWLGINYKENIYYEGNHDPSQVLRNCVHPDLGLHVFEQSKREGLFTTL